MSETKNEWSFDILKRGGHWLGAVRSWMQTRCRNGEDVTWGSHDRLERTFTVKDVEEIASIAVTGYINHDSGEIERERERKAALALCLKLGWKEGLGNKSGVELMPHAVEEIQKLTQQRKDLVEILDRLMFAPIDIEAAPGLRPIVADAVNLLLKIGKDL